MVWQQKHTWNRYLGLNLVGVKRRSECRRCLFLAAVSSECKYDDCVDESALYVKVQIYKPTLMFKYS